jgi:ankyrin repeat protein
MQTLEISDDSECTLLHEAVLSGDYDTVSRLLSYGASTKCVNLDHHTPLVCAIKKESVRICLLLLRHNANPDSFDRYNYTPLQHAQSLPYSSVCFMECLLANGADPEIQYVDTGNTVLHQAVVGFGASKKTPISPFHEPDPERHIIKPNLGQVRLLLSYSVNINALNEDHATPLHIAVRADNNSVISLLIKAGAELEVKNRFGATPLHNACRDGSNWTVEHLIHAGAKITAQTDRGQTPLHQAVYRGDVGIIRTLILAGADPNARDFKSNKAVKLTSSEDIRRVVSVALLEKTQLDNADVLNKEIHRAIEAHVHNREL